MIVNNSANSTNMYKTNTHLSSKYFYYDCVYGFSQIFVILTLCDFIGYSIWKITPYGVGNHVPALAQTQ